MHAYMYVWMYGKITNKQSFEWNMYTTWDASLQDFCGRTPWGTKHLEPLLFEYEF